VSGSLALLADAGHMATDAAGIGLAAIGGSRSVVSGRLGRSI
jgi:Co/Zn/Cd efflux system component